MAEPNATSRAAHTASALIFMDTETTGLSLDDDIWEFAAIRREPDGTETWRHLFIEHDGDKCARLPEAFRRDHEARFPRDGSEVARAVAAELIVDFIAEAAGPRPHIVGAVPNFDTERIALLLDRYEFDVPWHYHLIDVENLAVGYIAGVGKRAIDEARMRDDVPAIEWTRLAPPWDSDALSRACGVEPPGVGDRHTAMGDVRWVKALYDAITHGGRSAGAS